MLDAGYWMLDARKNHQINLRMKKYIPLFIKVNARRWQWFFKNYGKINQQSQVIDHSHYSGPITYDTDSITTSNNSDFTKDPRFVRSYAAAVETKRGVGISLQWRTYVLCWLADHVKHLEGDFVECGVDTGAYSRAVVEYVDFKKLNKKIYLMDTFEGLVAGLVTEEELKAGIEKYMDKYKTKNLYEQVRETFRDFNAVVIKGMIPDTLPQCTASKICYLSIDMNCVAPEIAAAEYFWDKIVPGGVVILDDYGFPAHILQKKAFDEFALRKNVSILSLPTGQGIIIKK
jgi:O-methyltransferase